jgi:hypothetical protein
MALRRIATATSKMAMTQGSHFSLRSPSVDDEENEQGPEAAAWSPKQTSLSEIAADQVVGPLATTHINLGGHGIDQVAVRIKRAQ